MKLIIHCLQCGIEGHSTEEAYAVDVTELVHWIECSRGHSTATVLGFHLFEILGDVATCAIVDGYYREAVSSFAACLERFYETFLAIRFAGRGKTDSEWELFWKAISNQTERQHGAFVLEYVEARGKPPNVLTHKQREFRNDVVHKGRIPSRAEALEFGQWVVDLVYPDYRWLRKNHEDAHWRVLGRRYVSAAGGAHAANYSGRCLFSRNEDLLADPIAPKLLDYVRWKEPYVRSARRFEAQKNA